jgi:hypothetical protein
MQAVTGCSNVTSNLDGVWASATLDGSPIEVHCDKWLCAAFNATGITANVSVRAAASSPPPKAANSSLASPTPSLGRRLTIEAPCAYRCQTATSDCLSCCQQYNWPQECPSRVPPCSQYSGCDKCDGQGTLAAKIAVAISTEV